MCRRLIRVSRSSSLKLKFQGVSRSTGGVIGSRRRGLSSTNNFVWSTEWIGRTENTDGKLLVFLHGLLGNKRNIKSFATSVCKSLDVPGLLMDIRGHGDSHMEEKFPTRPTSLLDCVHDLHMTLHTVVPDIKDREFILLGHSMGGRLSMMYAMTENVIRPSHVWLLDTVPGRLHHSVLNVMEIARKIVTDPEQQVPTNRTSLTHWLVQKHGLDLSTAQWLASSYDPQSTRKFTFDLPVAHDLVQEFDHQNFLDWINQVRRQKQVIGIHMVRGGINRQWEASNCLDLIHSWELEANDPKRFSFHTLPTAGHWIHIDDPKGLLRAVELIHKT